MSRKCWWSHNIAALCDECGAWADEIHLPLNQHGFYCPEHCPCCNAARKPERPLPRRPAAYTLEGSSDGK